jgi:hypothetical protein
MGEGVAISMYRQLYIAAIAAAISACTVSAHAGLPAYRTRSIPSANGKYLLVLLAPETGRDTDESLTEAEVRERKEVQQIEKRYPQSGLYRNDGSTDLLWPINYLSVSKKIYVSDDGVHLIVAFLDWETVNVSDRGHALEFYAHGQQLSAYNEDTLLDGYFGRCMLSSCAGVPWTTCSSGKLNDNAGTFDIVTNWGDEFRFDIANGKVIDSTTSWSVKVTYLVFVVLIALCGWWLLRGCLATKLRSETASPP